MGGCLGFVKDEKNCNADTWGLREILLEQAEGYSTPTPPTYHIFSTENTRYM